ncbi:hypothetical protein BSF41_39310 [Flavobacterium sp. ACN2]|jgi:hypothetical protein|nr:hypothetical protein BSF41_39310 [Flavobacterium sp. ACN2]
MTDMIMMITIVGMDTVEDNNAKLLAINTREYQKKRYSLFL